MVSSQDEVKKEPQRVGLWSGVGLGTAFLEWADRVGSRQESGVVDFNKVDDNGDDYDRVMWFGPASIVSDVDSVFYPQQNIPNKKTYIIINQRHLNEISFDRQNDQSISHLSL